MDPYIASDIVSIAAQVAGEVAQVLVTDNQAVVAGDVLLRLDASPCRAALAAADVDLAQAAIDNTDELRVSQSTRVAAAQSDLYNSTVQRGLACTGDKRARTLLANFTPRRSPPTAPLPP